MSEVMGSIRSALLESPDRPCLKVARRTCFGAACLDCADIGADLLRLLQRPRLPQQMIHPRLFKLGLVLASAALLLRLSLAAGLFKFGFPLNTIGVR